MDLLNLDVVRNYWGALAMGLLITVSLTFVVFAISVALAIPVALGRLSGSRWIRFPVSAYVEFIRGTPLLLQLLYIYYVFPSFGIMLGAYTAAVIGLSLNYTAYISEVYRGGIKSVARGQSDAAAALGMTGGLAFRRIILPQAFRMVIPTLGNYLISLFKDTALASVVTVQELMFSGQLISARSYQYFTVYTITGILYFSVSYPTALAVSYLEKRTSVGYRARRRGADVKMSPSAEARDD